MHRHRPDLPSNDRRWKLVNATMRRNGYADDALIEALHSVQDGSAEQQACNELLEEVQRLIETGMDVNTIAPGSVRPRTTRRSVSWTASGSTTSSGGRRSAPPGQSASASASSGVAEAEPPRMTNLMSDLRVEVADGGDDLVVAVRRAATHGLLAGLVGEVGTSDGGEVDSLCRYAVDDLSLVDGQDDPVQSMRAGSLAVTIDGHA